MRYWIYGDREDEAQVLDVKTNKADLSGLYPFCDYETRVCAYNAMGDGHFSSMVPCQTLEDGGSSSRRPHLTSFILHPLPSASPPLSLHVSWNIVMKEFWSIVLTRAMDHCDEMVMEHCDDKNSGAL